MGQDIYLKRIRNLIMNRLKGRKFQLFLFGSQVEGKAGHTSDIDIAIMWITDLPHRLLIKLRKEIEESNIPYSVDLVYTLYGEFKGVISSKKEGDSKVSLGQFSTLTNIFCNDQNEI